MVCSHQAGGRWAPGQAWEGLAPQHRPGTEVQKEDLGRVGTLLADSRSSHRNVQPGLASHKDCSLNHLAL